MSYLRALQRAYNHYLTDRRRERLFLASAGFFVGFAGARGLAHAIRNGALPFGNVKAGGTHIHHSFWGILSLVGIGYAWLTEIGTGSVGSRQGMRVMAVLYGIAAALTLDELALWIKPQNEHPIRDDEYWQRTGRKSIYAISLYGSLLLGSAFGFPRLQTLFFPSQDRYTGEAEQASDEA